VERNFGQLWFSVNGKGFEIEPEPIPIAASQNGIENKVVSLTPTEFDRFAERVRKMLYGE